MNHLSQPLKTIQPDDLLCMNDYAWEHPMAVELAYMRDSNLLFGEQIYRTGAKLWLHKDLAKIVIAASRHVFKATGGVLVLYDGLRVRDAQKAMLETRRVRSNPQWLEEPRLLSPPGAGGHPRGMAVDVSIRNSAGELLDMGTPFDFLSNDPSPQTNPAHRDYAHSQQVQDNRKILDDAMMSAAREKGSTLHPLPQEWWDYRLPKDVYEQYAPLSDSDLPAHMRLMD
ncbi:MAG: M15 family metallopeptidase [Alphaproteobacteria bacterium]|nr:M15 family metallopeptidase [Alphaproteobacteria bacterium]